jgi:hypothetical protein
MFKSGILPSKMTEFCAKVGIQAPTATNFDHVFQFVYQESLDISDEQLWLNQIEHNSACRASPNYEGDMQYTDSAGRVRKVARGSIITDRGGTKHWHQHIAKGNQHILIIFSKQTGKPIMAITDQNCCGGVCSCIFTQHIKVNNLKAHEVKEGEVDLKHKGPCYQNSKHRPVNAEEFAMEQAGELFLWYNDDNECSFVEEIVSDGDTKGPKRLIARQLLIIGKAAEGQAVHTHNLGPSHQEHIKRIV